MIHSYKVVESFKVYLITRACMYTTIRPLEQPGRVDPPMIKGSLRLFHNVPLTRKRGDILFIPQTRRIEVARRDDVGTKYHDNRLYDPARSTIPRPTQINLKSYGPRQDPDSGLTAVAGSPP